MELFVCLADLESAMGMLHGKTAQPRMAPGTCAGHLLCRWTESLH